MIKIKNLAYKYRRGRTHVLRDVSFEIKSGEIVALMGSNGSGKSTVGKLIAGIITPRKNQIWVDDIDVGVKRHYKEVFAKIGIVFQNPETQIFFDNVRDEMSFVLNQKDDVDGIIDEALERVNMVDRGDSLWDFSLGQKQRIVLAEMLTRKPKYLVLDEPTTMIDSVGKTEIWKIIRKLRSQDLGILLITNSKEEALVADRIITLQNGHIKNG